MCIFELAKRKYINLLKNLLMGICLHIFISIIYAHRTHAINFSLSSFQNIITLMGRSMNNSVIYTIVH